MQADVEAQEDTEENLEEDPEEVLDETGPRYFVNPEIVWASEETRNYQEGCLSVPGFYDDVARPAQCRVAFLDYDGQSQELECDGLLATCIQHEMDHLEGIVFLDRLSRLKRQIVLKKIAKAARDAASAE
jgi:peptide deformylase